MTARRPGFSYRATAIFLFLFLALLATASLAQTQQEVSRYDVFTGFSYMRFDSQSIGFTDQSNLFGGELEGAFNITRKYGIVLGASANVGNEIKLYNFLIGPQYNIRRANDTFFVRGLFGKDRDQVSASKGFTSIGLTYGGGVGYDRHYGSHFDLRVVEIDYLNAHSYRATQKNVRVSTGLIFHFGGK